MNLISIDQISKKNGPKLILDDISFGIHAGEKTALIGKNGTGKTTLLNLLTLRDEPDSGSILHNSKLRYSYVNQKPDFDDADTIWQYIFERAAPGTLARSFFEYKQAEKALATEKMSGPEFEALQEKMNRSGAFRLENDARAILARFGLKDMQVKMGILSGGNRRKAALARALIEPVDLLILDEPTNHLDIDGILWLERYLEKLNSGLLLVTHDRYFLDRVVDQVMELEDGKLYTYKTAGDGYVKYLELKAERERIESAAEEKKAKALKAELEWLKKTPRARRGKAKARIDSIDKLKIKKGAATLPASGFETEAGRQGKRILELKKVTKGYGGITYLNNITYYFKRGEKAALIGPNGAGKSTLLNIITGRLEPDTGHVNVGLNTKIGYFDQETMDLPPDKSVLGFIKGKAEYIKLRDKRITAGQFLDHFLYPPKMQNQHIGTLSGGERRKLALLSVLIENPNFLILDEPTNDLDIPTLNVLEEFLSAYEGNLLVVSHDRYFLDKVAQNVLVLEPGEELIAFAGGAAEYAEYRRLKKREAKESAAGGSDADATEVRRKKKTKLSYKDQIEYDKIQQEIPKLEAKLKELEKDLQTGDAQKLQDAGAEYVNTEELLMSKMERAMTLLETLD